MIRLDSFLRTRSRRRLLAVSLALLLILISAAVVFALGYDFTPAGRTEIINGAIFEVFNPDDPTGSGNFNSFVRLSSNSPIIRGYNTSYRPLQFEENSSPTFTRDQLLSVVPVVEQGGMLYREFQLDINQNTGGATSSLETLDNVELYESPHANLCGYPFDGSGGSHAGCTTNNTATLVWGLDTIGDNWLVLDYDNNSGSGKRDLRLLVPTSLFSSDPACGYLSSGCTTYITLYSKFGEDAGPGNETSDEPIVETAYGNNDGFEEWGVAIYPLAEKSGMKFHDLDADGVKDLDEPGLEGWKIYVDLNNSSSFDDGEPFAMTGSDGSYLIENIPLGTYYVREEGQSGWTCSFPAPCYYYETFESDGIYENNDFGNWQYATKSGTKYEDVNADGDLSDGLPVDGVTIYLLSSDGSTIIDSEVTAGGGNYEFDMVRPGVDYLVCEMDVSPDWTQSFPDNSLCAGVTATSVEDGGYAINLDSNETESGNDFGNWRYGKKSGTKYEDVNADGDLSDGLPVDGVTIYLLSSDGSTIIDSEVTAGGGNYEFDMVRPGVDYLVCEMDVSPDWTQSFPDNSLCAGVTATSVEDGGYAINLDSNETESGNDFGNWRYGKKSGTKYEDVNADGDLSDGLPVDGVTIYLLSSDGSTIIDSEVTAAGGNYEFDMVRPGMDYLVCEIDVSPDWTQSFPDNSLCAGVTATAVEDGGYAINLDSNETESGNDFGNWRYGKKSGTKYEDVNADGDLSDGLPVDGVTIYLLSSDGSTIIDSEVTAGGGNYEFDMVRPGVDYLVCEMDVSPDWTQSFPDNSLCAGVTATAVEDGGYAINLDSNETESGNDFGNWRYGKKSGTKYEDVNADGDLSDGLPVDGVTIYLLSSDGSTIIDSEVTAAGGNYEFDMVRPGVDYLVCEMDVSPDWTQSFPDNSLCAGVTATAVEDGGYAINLDSNETESGNDFGNWRYGKKSGTKYEDVNADGDLSDGLPVDGVTIYLLSSDGSTIIDSEVTAGGGNYEFDMVRPGVDYLVCEIDVSPDWTQSFPDNSLCAGVTATAVEDGGYAINLDSNETESGNDFGNWRYGKKSGTKYEDVNADGDLSDGLPVDGVTIYLLSSDGSTIIDSEVTAAGGNYEFDMVRPGVDYLVCEIDVSPDWTQSFPDNSLCAGVTATAVEDGGYAINLDSNETESGNDFGNWQPATKAGVKTDADFQTPLSGWTIELWDITTGTPVFVISDTTGIDGSYSFDSVMPGGTYVVCEVLIAGYTQVFPTALTPPPDGESLYGCSILGAGYGAYGYQFTPLSGEEYLDNDFANEEPLGCTYTQGYWKTHSIFGPAGPANDAWYTTEGPWAPGAQGPTAELFDSGLNWLQVFNTPPRGGNAWFILAHQWMAAYLNYYGTNSGGAGIVALLSDGAWLLDAYDYDTFGDNLIPKDSDDRVQAIILAELLDQYNNGFSGPLHCE